MWGGPDPVGDIAVAARSTGVWKLWRELSVQREAVGRGAKAVHLPNPCLSISVSCVPCAGSTCEYLRFLRDPLNWCLPPCSLGSSLPLVPV